MSESEFDPVDAVAYDLHENPDYDGPEPDYEAYLDSALTSDEDLEHIVRDDLPERPVVIPEGLDAHETWEQVSATDPDPPPQQIPSGLEGPRLAGYNRPRRGEILVQRTRVKVGDFVTDDELRVFLAEQTEWEWADLVRPTPPGRLNTDERHRREELARLVGLARSRGAAFETLARVLNRSLATVHALASSASA